DPDHLVGAPRARRPPPFLQIGVDETTLSKRTRPDGRPVFFFPAWRPAAVDFVVGFFLPGLLPLVGRAPRRPGGRRARGATPAAAVRMVDRIHRYAAIVRHAPHPALASGLADRNVHIVGVRHRADRRHAAAMHHALLGRVEAQDDVFAVAADDLGIGAG